MATRLNPYIGFRDNAREAMEFYHDVFGGKLSLQTFEEMHAAEDPSENHLIMHGMLEADDGLVIMACDTPKRMEFRPGTNMSISLSGDDDETLSGFFDKLAAGGNITMPLEKAMWGDKFGMVTDKFGTAWMVNISGKH